MTTDSLAREAGKSPSLLVPAVQITLRSPRCITPQADSMLSVRGATVEFIMCMVL